MICGAKSPEEYQNMQLFADSFFTIGYPHVNQGIPCQDYAVSGVMGDVAYGIVSDGCSSSPATDIGS